jgi:GNAT superfamily N-acetyltransferase
MAPSEPTAGLADDELADAAALVREAGWNQLAADWDVFRELGTVHAVRDAGRVVATAATLPYGHFGWISMVLVAGEYRQHGLGTRLLHRCIDELLAAQRVPALDATPAGRLLYRTLGFEDSWSFQRLMGRGSQRSDADALPPTGTMIRAIDDSVWPPICDYDAGAFGADRSNLLARLRERLPAAARVAERGGRIAGFLLGRDGRSATQLGPLVAEDDDTARALLAPALDAIDGAIYIDVADVKAGIHPWLAGHGFVSQRPFTRMLRGRAAGFDDPTRTFAVVGPEFG